MKHPSRQREYNPIIVNEFGQNYKKVEVLKEARKGEALEGTGCIVIDSRLKKIYCCISKRANYHTLIKFSMKLSKLAKESYQLITFTAKDQQGDPVFHTNVLLAILDKHTVTCLDAIDNEHDK